MIYQPTLFWGNNIYWLLVTEISFGWGRQMHHVRSLLLVQNSLYFLYLMSPYFVIESLIKDPAIPKKEETHSTFFPTRAISLWIPRFCHIPNPTLRLWHMENSSGTASLQKVYFGFKALFSVLQRSRTKSLANASFFWGSSLSFLSTKKKNAQKFVHNQNPSPLL